MIDSVDSVYNMLDMGRYGREIDNQQICTPKQNNNTRQKKKKKTENATCTNTFLAGYQVNK